MIEAAVETSGSNWAQIAGMIKLQALELCICFCVLHLTPVVRRPARSQALWSSLPAWPFLGMPSQAQRMLLLVWSF